MTKKPNPASQPSAALTEWSIDGGITWQKGEPDGTFAVRFTPGVHEIMARSVGTTVIGLPAWPPSPARSDREQDEEDALIDLRKAVLEGASDVWLMGFIRGYPFTGPARSDKDAEHAESGTLTPDNCPFCGGCATYLMDRISCDCCLADMHRAKGQSDDELLAAWSRRAERPPSGEGIDPLWAEMQRLSRYRYSSSDGMVAAPSGGFYSCTDVQAMIAVYIDARRATAGTTAAPSIEESFLSCQRRHQIRDREVWNEIRDKAQEKTSAIIAAIDSQGTTAGNAAPTEAALADQDEPPPSQAT